jgi:hypothetical protein
VKYLSASTMSTRVKRINSTLFFAHAPLCYCKRVYENLGSLEREKRARLLFVISGKVAAAVEEDCDWMTEGRAEYEECFGLL